MESKVITPAKIGLDPHEWNFEGVPEPELVACCVWEYARESETLGLHHFVCSEWWWDSQPVKPNPDGDGIIRNALDVQEHARNLLKKVQEKTGFDIEAFREGFWKHDLTSVFGSATRIPHNSYSFLRTFGALRETRWRDLPVEARQFLAQLYTQPAQYASAYDLRQLLGRYQKLNDPPHGESQKDMLAAILDDQNPLGPVQLHPGRMVVAFEINWNAYDVGEIAAHLDGWARKNCPLGVRPTKSRGHHEPKIDFAKKLRDLGVMRLMHETEPGNMKRRQPEAWSLFHDQLKWTERYWNLAHERALKNFRALLPFLPQGELPIHNVTKAKQNKRPDGK